MKYYGIRIFAALLVMGSPVVGILVGIEYGKRIGWICFFIALAIGIALHYQAQRIRQTTSK